MTIYPRARAWPLIASLAMPVALTTWWPVASHADTEGDRTKLFEEGRALAAAGKYSAAAQKFRAVIAIRSAPKALIALGVVEEKQGHLIAAREAYARAASDAVAAKLADDRSVAEAAIARVDAALPRITVRVAGSATKVQVSLDGSDLPKPWTDIRVDPGEHALTVEGDGAARVDQHLELVAGDRRIVDVTLTAGPRADLPHPEPGAAAVPWLPLVIGGVGLVTTGIGLVVRQSGAAEEDARKDKCRASSGDELVCKGVSEPSGAGKINTGNALLIGGGILAVGGAAWLIYDLTSARSARTARAHPLVTQSLFGIAVSGSF